jgi:hypothetical protein
MLMNQILQIYAILNMVTVTVAERLRQQLHLKLMCTVTTEMLWRPMPMILGGEMKDLFFSYYALYVVTLWCSE